MLQLRMQRAFHVWSALLLVAVDGHGKAPPKRGISDGSHGVVLDVVDVNVLLTAIGV
jgi:hypothetical protein